MLFVASFLDFFCDFENLIELYNPGPIFNATLEDFYSMDIWCSRLAACLANVTFVKLS